MNGINITLTQDDIKESNAGKLTIKETKLLNCFDIDNRFFRNHKQNIMYFNEDGYWEQMSKDNFADNIQRMILKKAHEFRQKNFKFWKVNIISTIVNNLRAKLDNFPSFDDIEAINADNNYRVITKSYVYNINTTTAQVNVIENMGQYYNFVALKDFDPDYHISDEELLSPDMKNFFNFISKGDRQLVDYLQELMGHTLVHGYLSQPYIYILYGGGKNGKSVFIDLLSRLVNQKKSALNFSDVSMKTAGTLERNFINVPSELDGNRTINESMLKSITSGDAIEIDEKYLLPRTMKPIAKQIGAANTLFACTDSSDGLWRRLQIIPFFAQITKAQEKTPEYFHQLFQSEMPSITQWAFRGLLRLIKNKGYHSHCNVVENAVKKYKLDENAALQFMTMVHELVAHDNQHVLKKYNLKFSQSNIDHDTYTVSQTNIYNGFKLWASAEGIKQLSAKQFHQKIEHGSLPWLGNVKKSGAKAYALKTFDLRQKNKDSGFITVPKTTQITVTTV